MQLRAIYADTRFFSNLFLLPGFNCDLMNRLSDSTCLLFEHQCISTPRQRVHHFWADGISQRREEISRLILLGSLEAKMALAGLWRGGGRESFPHLDSALCSAAASALSDNGPCGQLRAEGSQPRSALVREDIQWTQWAQSCRLHRIVPSEYDTVNRSLSPGLHSWPSEALTGP